MDEVFQAGPEDTPLNVVVKVVKVVEMEDVTGCCRRKDSSLW